MLFLAVYNLVNLRVTKVCPVQVLFCKQPFSAHMYTNVINLEWLAFLMYVAQVQMYKLYGQMTIRLVHLY